MSEAVEEASAARATLLPRLRGAQVPQFLGYCVSAVKGANLLFEHDFFFKSTMYDDAGDSDRRVL